MAASVGNGSRTNSSAKMSRSVSPWTIGHPVPSTVAFSTDAIAPPGWIGRTRARSGQCTQGGNGPVNAGRPSALIEQLVHEGGVQVGLDAADAAVLHVQDPAVAVVVGGAVVHPPPAGPHEDDTR